MTSPFPLETILNHRYQILQELGRGGMARTFLAKDLSDFDRSCVVKEFHPHVTDEISKQKCRDLFFREAKILAQLKHDQIPSFIDQFEVDGQLYWVQEYVEGQTYLQALKSRGGQFSETEVRAWLSELLNVLDYLHQNLYYHQDISPDNIILRKCDRKPVLIDFGAVTEAIAFQGQSILRKTSISKVGYSSPEQIRANKVSAKSDLYSLAVTAVVLLTGKDPQELIDDENQWQWHSFVHITAALSLILDKMLQQKPSDRYGSAAEALAALMSPISAGVSRSTGMVTEMSQAPGDNLPTQQPFRTQVIQVPGDNLSTQQPFRQQNFLIAAVLGFIGLIGIGAIIFSKAGFCHFLHTCPPTISPSFPPKQVITPSPMPPPKNKPSPIATSTAPKNTPIPSRKSPVSRTNPTRATTRRPARKPNTVAKPTYKPARPTYKLPIRKPNTVAKPTYKPARPTYKPHTRKPYTSPKSTYKPPTRSRTYPNSPPTSPTVAKPPNARW